MITGRLRPTLIDMERLKMFVDKEPLMRTSLLAYDPSVIYSIGRLYPVHISIQDLEFGYIMELPIPKPDDLLGLYTISNLGWNDKRNRRMLRLGLPRHVTLRVTENKTLFHEVQADLCDRTVGLWYCPVTALVSSYSVCVKR